MSEFEYTDINDPTSGTPAQRAAAEEMLAAAVEHYRDEAIKAHPGAAKLREYLTADGTKAGIMALAAELEGKLGTGEETPAPGAAVRGGSPALSGTRHPGDDNYDLEAAQQELRQTRNHDAVMMKLIRSRLDAAGHAPLEG